MLNGTAGQSWSLPRCPPKKNDMNPFFDWLSSALAGAANLINQFKCKIGAPDCKTYPTPPTWARPTSQQNAFGGADFPPFPYLRWVAGG